MSLLNGNLMIKELMALKVLQKTEAKKRLMRE